MLVRYALLLCYWDACATDFSPSWAACRRRRKPRNPKRSAAMRRRWERVAEEHDEVRRNLGGDLVALAIFERVKHKLRATPRTSLTDVFLDYLHDNTGLVAETLAAQADDPCAHYGTEPEPDDPDFHSLASFVDAQSDLAASWVAA